MIKTVAQAVFPSLDFILNDKTSLLLIRPGVLFLVEYGLSSVYLFNVGSGPDLYSVVEFIIHKVGELFCSHLVSVGCYKSQLRISPHSVFAHMTKT